MVYQETINKLNEFQPIMFLHYIERLHLCVTQRIWGNFALAQKDYD
jgi:hypothetical protein